MRLIGLVVDSLGTERVVYDQKVNVGVEVCRVEQFWIRRRSMWLVMDVRG